MKYLFCLLGLSISLGTVLSGCTTVDPIYYYGNYNTAVYSYLKAEDVTLEEQISSLQQTIETAEAKSKPIAPGIHAHLGMLYFETGDSVQGKEHLELEKNLYPESGVYIDFLLNSAKGSGV